MGGLAHPLKRTCTLSTYAVIILFDTCKYHELSSIASTVLSTSGCSISCHQPHHVAFAKITSFLGYTIPFVALLTSGFSIFSSTMYNLLFVIAKWLFSGVLSANNISIFLFCMVRIPAKPLDKNGIPGK